MTRNPHMVGFRVWSGLALGIAFGLATAGCGSDEPAAPPSGGSGTTQKVLILHTNDLHSYLNGFAPEQDYTPLTKGDDTTRGGMARLAAAIASERASAASAHEPVLLLDAGDFMMGTLFELLGTTQAPELTFLQDLGYDATTLGNHEFDWTSAGLAAILNAAATNGVHVPIVASNLQFSASDGDDALEAVASAGMIQPKLVKTVGKLKVGFFGLLGSDAATVTPQAAPVTFEAIADAANRMVTELRETDHVDLVVALSHSGIHADGTGEDAKLAMDAPGIDLIVSGHTHDSLSQPVQVGSTWIVTAGSYGRFLGELSLSVTPATKAGETATLSIDDYTLRDIDDSIAGDAATQTKVDAYVYGIDAALAGAGLAYPDVVATTGTDLPLPTYAEAPIGNLVTDAYLTLGAALEPDEPPVIAVEANGQIRADIKQGTSGNVWLADLFRV